MGVTVLIRLTSLTLLPISGLVNIGFVEWLSSKHFHHGSFILAGSGCSSRHEVKCTDCCYIFQSSTFSLLNCGAFFTNGGHASVRFLTHLRSMIDVWFPLVVFFNAMRSWITFAQGPTIDNIGMLQTALS